jgi:hypothetical protein
MSSHQRLIDQLTIALPLIQRAGVVGRQQQQDLADALAAIERAAAIIRASAPPAGAVTRPVSNLELAIARAGRSIAEAAYLAGLPEHRLRAIIGGERPTADEREAIQSVVSDWNGGAR